MKKLTTNLILLIFLPSLILAQETEHIRQNPIVFVDGFAGMGSGFSAGATFNFQEGNHLFLARYLLNANISQQNGRIGFVGIPSYKVTSENSEYGLLYGRRYITRVLVIVMQQAFL